MSETIDIPQAVVVRCPLVAFKLRSVGRHCPGCEHFHGLQDKYPGSPIAFEKRYTVLCAARPTVRDLFEVEVSE